MFIQFFKKNKFFLNLIHRNKLRFGGKINIEVFIIVGCFKGTKKRSFMFKFSSILKKCLKRSKSSLLSGNDKRQQEILKRLMKTSFVDPSICNSPRTLTYIMLTRSKIRDPLIDRWIFLGKKWLLPRTLAHLLQSLFFNFGSNPYKGRRTNDD